VINHHLIDGVTFKSNVLDNAGTDFTTLGDLLNQKIQMQQINDWLFAPSDGQSALVDTMHAGFDFETIETDLFGSVRSDGNAIGAICNLSTANSYEIDKGLYGPPWFSVDQVTAAGKVIAVSSASGALSTAIANALSGDIIELTDTDYQISKSFKIDKEITIRSNEKSQVSIKYTGNRDTPLFQMLPYGNLRLDNVSLKGTKTQLAFAPLKVNMSAAYNLHIDNSTISDFDYILEASKGSFADSLIVQNTIIKDCNNGLVLAADVKGDYNAEMVTFDGCTFDNITQNVIHFYRGGYDESTIGGYLSMTNNTFTKSGKAEESGVLIKTRGIINVLLADNTFKSNPVDYIAILWGEKENYHRDNRISQSGSIKVEEQQKLELLY